MKLRSLAPIRGDLTGFRIKPCPTDGSGFKVGGFHHCATTPSFECLYIHIFRVVR